MKDGKFITLGIESSCDETAIAVGADGHFMETHPDPDRALEVMDTVDFAPFPLALEGFGRFGDLWWAGLKPCPPLQSYVRGLRRAPLRACRRYCSFSPWGSRSGR